MVEEGSDKVKFYIIKDKYEVVAAFTEFPLLLEDCLHKIRAVYGVTSAQLGPAARDRNYGVDGIDE